MDIQQYLIQSKTTQRQFAEKVGVTQGFISRLVQGEKVPPALVIPIEKATSGVISRHELRPDIYPLD